MDYSRKQMLKVQREDLLKAEMLESILDLEEMIANRKHSKT